MWTTCVGSALSTRTIATAWTACARLTALSPSYPTDWLMHGINKLRHEPSDRRRTRQRSQHTARLVELGMDLMNQACRPAPINEMLRRQSCIGTA
jgi:hypothetical protein